MAAKFALACSSIEVEKLTRSISTDFGVRLPSELLKDGSASRYCRPCRLGIVARFNALDRDIRERLLFRALAFTHRRELTASSISN